MITLSRGKGDRAEVLTGKEYMAWDTEEFSAMLEWMKSYNQTVPDEKKIRFLEWMCNTLTP